MLTTFSQHSGHFLTNTHCVQRDTCITNLGVMGLRKELVEKRIESKHGYSVTQILKATISQVVAIQK